MRVTERLLFDTALRDTGRARSDAEQAQRVAATGTRVEHPGDDPAASGLVVAFRMSSQRNAAISSAAAAASDELATADTALANVSSVLSRARQLAVQFSNSTYSQAQRANAAEEVQGLFGQIVSALNARSGSRYVFGGTKDDAPPFDAGGSYLGDDGERRVEVAPDVFQPANVLVGDFSTDANGVLAALAQLQGALTTGDASAVQATLDGLDAGIDQVSGARARIGVSMNTFDAATSAAKAASGDDDSRAHGLTDADIIESSIKLQATQTALQASLTATAQSFRLSLLDFLK